MMTYEEALIRIKNARALAKTGLYNISWYINYVVGDKEVTLDGEFTADDLEAIAVYMRHHQAEQAEG